MTAEYPQGDKPLIPMPALSLPALRQAVATVAPSRLPEFFQEIQDAFTQAGEEDSVFPIRHFYQRWEEFMNAGSWADIPLDPPTAIYEGTADMER